MTDGLHEYAFEVTVSLRVNARSLQEAKATLAELLNCATIAVVMEGEPNLYEFDGQSASDINGTIRIEGFK